MKLLTDIVRWLAPTGIIERHRRKFQMQRLGLPVSARMAAAAVSCRYDLWPSRLRRGMEPWILVDVGANEGEFTEAVSRIVSLKRIYAFEPQPECHGSLRKVLDSLPDSHLHGVAVGSEEGEIELLCTGNSKMASVLRPDTTVEAGYVSGDFSIETRLKVPLKRLDDVIPRGTQIGMLKIDVQGYELAVLEGARETLRSTYALLMEVNYVPHYHGGATFDELFEAVQLHGFRTYGISAPYGGPNGPLWADAMFVRV